MLLKNIEGNFSPQTINKLQGACNCITNGKFNVKRLFRIATESPDLWYYAYQNIYSNDGAMTKGVDGTTMDGFSVELVKEVIESLKNGKYRPKPSKRVYIPKSKGKKRPLGVLSMSDKLTQEVWRIILNLLYDPVFSEHSHGFRSNRSCHTALKEITKWRGIKWFIEFDIRGCFDNIDHNVLMKILEKKIDDRRFLAVIRKWLKAGYLENWSYNKTYSGTPQGNLCKALHNPPYAKKVIMQSNLLKC